jgi:hypothetical protein
MNRGLMHLEKRSNMRQQMEKNSEREKEEEEKAGGTDARVRNRLDAALSR